MNQLSLLDLAPPPMPERGNDLDNTIFAHQVIVPIDVSDRSDNAEKLFKAIKRMYQASHQDGAFHTFIDIVLAVLNRFNGGEGPYMEAIKGLPREALDAAVEGFGILKQHFWIEGCFYDILGDVYMQVRSDWAGKSMGQYFTPWPICMMMAQMTLDAQGDDIEQRLLHGPHVSMHEPCIGSGAMMLALKAAICERFGDRKYLRMLQIAGQDIDQVCVKMAKIQLMMSDDRYMTNFMLASMMEIKKWVITKKNCM